MYYLIYIPFYLFSLLPWFVMYRISDFLAWTVYHIFGYRKQVVMDNLAIVFPEKTVQERRRIARRFYRNFTDAVVELIKLISASERSIVKRFVGDTKVVDQMVNSGKQVQLHAMHNFSWEILNLNLARILPKPFLVVYQPLTNRHMERIVKAIRSRYGSILVSANDFKTEFRHYDREEYALALVADQNPSNPTRAWWVNFFGKPTPFVTGPEKAARLRNLAVVFGNFYSVRRGVYSFSAHLATQHAAETSEGELTLAFVRYVEKCIRERPDNYLWSHRRWKHAYKPEYAPLCLEPVNLHSV